MNGLKYSSITVFIAQALEYLFVPALLFIRHSNRSVEPKILIMEPFHIGDAVSLSAMLGLLRDKFPNYKIHLLLQDASAKLYENDKRVDRIHKHVLPWAGRANKYDVRDYLRTIKILMILRKERFTIGIDARGDIRSQIVLTLIGCPVRAGYTNYLCSNVITKGLHLTHNAGNLQPQQRPLLNLEIIKLLGCTIENPRLSLLAPKFTNRVLSGMDNAFEVVCHMGSGWKYRLWNEIRWLQLWQSMSREFKINITVIGEENEMAKLKLKHAIELANNSIVVKSTTIQALIETIFQMLSVCRVGQRSDSHCRSF